MSSQNRRFLTPSTPLCCLFTKWNLQTFTSIDRDDIVYGRPLEDNCNGLIFFTVKYIPFLSSVMSLFLVLFNQHFLGDMYTWDLPIPYLYSWCICLYMNLTVWHTPDAYESIAVHKSGLISEKISLWFEFPTKGVSYFPEHYLPREKMLRTVILSSFLSNFSESEKPSEVNPLLA